MLIRSRKVNRRVVVRFLRHGLLSVASFVHQCVETAAISTPGFNATVLMETDHLSTFR